MIMAPTFQLNVLNNIVRNICSKYVQFYVFTFQFLCYASNLYVVKDFVTKSMI